MTKWDKRQLMQDLETLRKIIKSDADLANRWLNAPAKPCTTPVTLITRSIRICRGGIKPL